MTDVLAWIKLDAPADTAKLVLPAVRLEVDREVTEPRLGSHRIGGNPDFPEGLDWPRWRNARMDFIAQVDLGAIADMPEAAGLPREGWLSFFYSSYGETWGVDPDERGSCAVLHHVGPRAALQRNYVTPDDDRDTVYPGFALAATPIWTMPSSNADVVADLPVGAHQAYVDLEVRLGEHYDTNGGASWLLGHANQFQGIDLASIAEENGPDGDSPWCLLFQVSPPDEWGFAGVMYYMIREADLAAGRFEDVWLLRED